MGGQARHQNFNYDSFGDILEQTSTVAPPDYAIDPLSFHATYGSNNRMLPASFAYLPLSAGNPPQGVRDRLRAAKCRPTVAAPSLVRAIEAYGRSTRSADFEGMRCRHG